MAAKTVGWMGGLDYLSVASPGPLSARRRSPVVEAKLPAETPIGEIRTGTGSDARHYGGRRRAAYRLVPIMRPSGRARPRRARRALRPRRIGTRVARSAGVLALRRPRDRHGADRTTPVSGAPSRAQPFVPIGPLPSPRRGSAFAYSKRRRARHR